MLSSPPARAAKSKADPVLIYSSFCYQAKIFSLIWLFNNRNLSTFLANKHCLVIELSLSKFLAVGDRIVAIAFLQ
jgi:hypothetical protein